MQVKEDGRKLVDHAIESLMRCVQLVDGALGTAESTLNCPIQQLTPVNQLPPSRPNGGEDDIQLLPYRRDESQLPSIMRLISAELSEPYSIYTYRYFIHHWPELCYLAEKGAGEYAGVIVCKMEKDQGGYCTGYIAMLAVEMGHRRKGIGTRLVQRAVDAMEQQGCDEVVLETEVTNLNAMNLYSQLGFIREKRLLRYYLNGVDAFRLKLYLTSGENDFGAPEGGVKDNGEASARPSCPESLRNSQHVQQPVI